MGIEPITFNKEFYDSAKEYIMSKKVPVIEDLPATDSAKVTLARIPTQVNIILIE